MMTPGPNITDASIPSVGRKGTVLRWEVLTVVRCENCREGHVILHSDEAQPCPVCRMVFKFVCFQWQEQRILPQELAISTLAFMPKQPTNTKGGDS